jgi:L-amino acid N-acyltransferase YncA
VPVAATRGGARGARGHQVRGRRRWDRWQGEGVGASLTHRLIEEARGNVVSSFYALVKGENKPMLHVFRHLNLPEQERVEDGEKLVEIGLLSRPRWP